MSRIINPDSAGKERTRLAKAIVLAIRELAGQTGPGPDSRDLAAFISLALQTISEGIDISVSAWEKRGYWVKADKFRMEWTWAGVTASKLREALEAEDWGTIAVLSAQTAQRFNKIKIPPNHRLGKPWVGAYNRIHEG
jgi:hypothetical protein